MLKVGGRIVYSTCSLNPIEDEAVVYSLLKKCNGSMKLINMDGYLPELKRRAGLKYWKVIKNNKMEELTSYESIPDKVFLYIFIRKEKNIEKQCFHHHQKKQMNIHYNIV